jgi:hypothetical protein
LPASVTQLFEHDARPLLGRARANREAALRRSRRVSQKSVAFEGHYRLLLHGIDAFS